MKKILVIGCPGAGKSTFSRNLSAILNIPLFHLDLIWHTENKTTITNEVFDEKLTEILNLETFIIDGTYTRTLKRRVKKSDTIFYFDLPADICLQGAKSRIGTKRSDLPYIETELDEVFAASITNFHKHKRFLIRDILKPFYDSKKIVTFKSHLQVDSYLAALIKKD